MLARSAAAHLLAQVRQELARDGIFRRARLDATHEQPVRAHAHLHRRPRQGLVDEVLAAVQRVLHVERVRGASEGGVAAAVGGAEAVQLVVVAQL